MAINLAPTDTTWKTLFSKGFETGRLSVAVFEKDGFAELKNLLDARELYRFIPDLSDGKAAGSWLSDVFGKRNYLFLAAKEKENSEVIGFLLLSRQPDRRMMLGGGIRPGFWNRGYAGDLLLGLVSFLETSSFREPLFAETRNDNLFVHKALEKAGFTQRPQDSARPGHLLFALKVI